MRKLFALTLLLLGAFVLLGAQGITLGKGATYGKGMRISPGSSGGGGTWAVLQGSVGAVQGASPLTLTFGSSNTPGSTIVVGTLDSPTTTTTDTVSDPTNGSYTQLVAHTNTSFDNTVGAIWCVHNTASSALTITFTNSAGSNHLFLAIAEFSGGTCTADGTSTFTATPPSASTLTLPNISTSTANDAVFGVFGSLAAGSITKGAAWTSYGIQNGAIVAVFEGILNQSVGSYAPTATLNTAETDYEGAGVALKP